MWAIAQPRARARSWAVDRVSVALVVVFVPAAAFYIWTAATSVPLSLHAGGADRYNLLATALLHLRLWVANAPAGLLHLAEPYNPAQNAPLVDTAVSEGTSLHDDVLYGSHLYFAWGPAPALVLLVPLHVLGWEPSASVTVAVFGVAGLGFALGVLRVVLRQLGDTPLWICVLAACAVALCTTVPFLLRTPSVTEDTIAGGFCFTMAGVWLLASTVVTEAGGHAPATEAGRHAPATEAGRHAPAARIPVSAIIPRSASVPVSANRASLWRPAAASLCFGLAAGSRPELGLAAVALVPVYFTLRSTHPRRSLLLALVVPVGVCFALLAAYNQARFGNPLEIGVRHQLAGYDQLHEPLGNLSYLAPGAWLYTLSPPRPTAAFPFLVLGPPPLSYPAGLPATYGQELTGGLVATTPIVVFLAALPWIWRRRPAWLGALAGPLVALAGAGVVFLLFLAFENRATTERYEVDFAGLVLLGALAAWLALASRTRGVLRRVVRVGGGLLVVWGCVTGFAVSFIGYGDFLAVEHHGEWNTLQDAGSPLTALIARIAGRPVLAEVLTKNVKEYTPVDYTSLNVHTEESFWLGAAERATIVVASPDTRTAALVLGMSPGLERSSGAIGLGGAAVGVTLLNSNHALGTYAVPPGGRNVRVALPLSPGVNRFELRPVPSTFTLPNQSNPTTTSLLLVGKLALESSYTS
jgi:hypothetical protein